MKQPKDIDVLIVAGCGPIVVDPAASARFHAETSPASLCAACGLETIVKGCVK